MSAADRQDYNRVDTIIASAGTGKTHRLIERITAAVHGGLAPERLLATTFTKKAAAELAGRIRSGLSEQGQPELAAAMLAARIGDPKQSIYGFRDADPALMQAAARAITTETGGSFGFLRKSYRTRPALGSFINAAFEPNFRRTGMTAEEITFDDYARSEAAEDGPPLSAWRLAGRNQQDRTDDLAARVAGLLCEPEGWFPTPGTACRDSYAMTRKSLSSIEFTPSRVMLSSA